MGNLTKLSFIFKFLLRLLYKNIFKIGRLISRDNVVIIYNFFKIIKISHLHLSPNNKHSWEKYQRF